MHEIQIHGQRLRHTGAGMSTAWVGSSAAIGWRYQVRSWLLADFPAVSSAAFQAAGIFALGVWSRRREALYLLFFVMSAVACVRTLHYFVSRHRVPISDEWFGWLTVSSLFWLVLTAHFFLRHLHGVRHRWLSITASAVTAVVSLATLPGGGCCPRQQLSHRCCTWCCWPWALPCSPWPAATPGVSGRKRPGCWAAGA